MQEKGILQGNLTKALLRMAVPLFVLNLVNSLYNIIDTFWVGQLGELQVGAVSLVGPIMWCAQSVGCDCFTIHTAWGQSKGGCLSFRYCSSILCDRLCHCTAHRNTASAASDSKLAGYPEGNL